MKMRAVVERDFGTEEDAYRNHIPDVRSLGTPANAEARFYADVANTMGLIIRITEPSGSGGNAWRLEARSGSSFAAWATSDDTTLHVQFPDDDELILIKEELDAITTLNDGDRGPFTVETEYFGGADALTYTEPGLTREQAVGNADNLAPFTGGIDGDLMPCYVQPQREGRVTDEGKYIYVTMLSIRAPLSADLKDEDVVTRITDLAGNVLYEGKRVVKGLMRRDTFLYGMLEEYA